MFTPTEEQLREIFKKKGYVFFDKGDFNINFFAVREDNIFDNYFSDTLIQSYYVDKKFEQVVIPGTTNAGLWGGRAVMNPRPGGVAIVKPGQYRNVWKFIDSYEGWLNYPYFQQVGKFTIWRDDNKDTIIDQTNEQVAINTGINCHRMSRINENGLTVNNWSEACIGAIEPEYKKLLEPTRESVKRYGLLFSFTLLMRSDFD